MKRKNFQKLLKGKFEREHQKKCGIYSIYFKDYDKYYIGSTNRGFYIRWRQHIELLRKNKHHNSIIQNMYNECGEKSIKFQIIEICEGSDDEILEREQFYLDFLKPELNVNQVAVSCKFPEGWISPTAKPVLQYDLDGNFIQEFYSLQEAKRNVPKCDIIQAIKKSIEYTSQAGGFQWRYKKSEDFERKIPKYYQGTTILCYDSNGDFYKEYKSISEASKDLNIPTGNISRAVSGNRNTHSAYGYFFKQKTSDEYPLKIYELLRIHKNQFCIDIEDVATGEKYHFNSLRQIPEKEFFYRGDITRYIKKELTEFFIRKRDRSRRFFVKVTKL